MIHKASWKNTSGFKYIIVLLGILFLGSGIFYKQIFFILPGAALFIYLFLIGKRLKVALLDDRIIYQGWFKKTDIPFKSIRSVTSALNFNYPRDRYYSPNTYEICTDKNSIRINLLYFDVDFRRKFQDIFIKNKAWGKNEFSPPVA
jgi:hypothetical protein